MSAVPLLKPSESMKKIYNELAYFDVRSDEQLMYERFRSIYEQALSLKEEVERQIIRDEKITPLTKNDLYQSLDDPTKYKAGPK